MAGARNGAIAAAVITATGGIIAAIITTSGGGGGGSHSPSSNTVASVTVQTPPPTHAPYQAAEIYLNRDSGPTGTQVLVSGQHFDANERVVLMFSTTQIGSTTTGPGGGFSNVAVTIPTGYAEFAPQQFEILAEGRNSSKSALAPFNLSG